MTEAQDLHLALGGFHPLTVLRWALRLARPLVRLDARQAAAWDLVEAIVQQPAGPPGPPGSDV